MVVVVATTRSHDGDGALEINNSAIICDINVFESMIPGSSMRGIGIVG